jgi:hypothetical protein
LEGTPGDGLCDNRFFETFKSEEAEVSWPVGTELSLSGAAHGTLAAQIGNIAEKHILFNNITVEKNSLILFDQRSLADTSSLVLSGVLALGEVAETGSIHLVQRGSYEIREALPLTPGTSIVATGQFLPGDYVRIEHQNGAPIPMRILITIPGSDLADFDVIATSPPLPSNIVVQRIGAKPTHITSRWMDRVTNDALPLALSIFLGLLGASLGIAKSLIGGQTPRKELPPET